MGHRDRPIAIRRALVPAGALLLLMWGPAWGGRHHPGAAPDLCGSGADLHRILEESHRRNVRARARSGGGGTLALQSGGLGDRIENDLLVLEDRGDLVVNNATDSLEILDRAIRLAGDRFDFITILTASTFPGNVSPEAGFAFFDLVNNDVGGVGLPPLQNPNLGVLRGFINLNDLDEYPNGPAATLPGFNGVVSGVEVLGQEAGHWTEAYIASPPVAPLLGRDAAHWSFYLQSRGSVMEGNLWLDNGDGTFTTAPPASQFDTYSQLDLYLWGLIPPAGVTEPMFVITNPTANPGQGRFSFPQGGFTTGGTRVDVTMADILAANGARDPAWPEAPTQFTMAFVLVVPFGQPVSSGDMQIATQFRNAWEGWFGARTEGRGSFETRIPDIPVAGDFTAEPRAGGPAPFTVAFESHPRGTVTGMLWDFGDGSTSTEPNPDHTYLTNGVFQVTLRIDGYAGPAVVQKPGFVVVGNFAPVLVDDFETESGWAPDAADTAAGGRWERADPEATMQGVWPVQPAYDHTPGAGTLCWVTGAAAGGSPGANDVDGGVTSLVSPVFGLDGMENAWLAFFYWYTNDLGSAPGLDDLRVELSGDGGTSWALAARIASSASRWRYAQILIPDVAAPTDAMRVRFVASDLGGASLVEALVDDVAVIALPRADRDLDGVADGLDNCLDGFNPGQIDSDGDGPGDACDCAPSDPLVSREPGEVGPTLAFLDATALRWNGIPQATAYNLYRGVYPPAGPHTLSPTCEAPGLSLPGYDAAAGPPPGSAYYYLATGRNCFGEGPPGPDSTGAPRPLPAPCP